MTATLGMTPEDEAPREGAQEGPAIGRPTSPLPADPAQYDSDRARIARAKGLPSPYIAGGSDPDPGPGIREERFYGRLLLGMVITIIVAGFVLGILITLVTGRPSP
jgi:hypothetical protein